ncbi:MAG: hypothetical protein CK529_10420 [Rhodospirillaceae bacterium]|nr:MAG: hypothetical protein CK529_10420 [Rhodospirillaceae bacterium]
MTSSGPFLEGTSGPYRDVVDYILGITHEIWESRKVDKIDTYYAAQTPVYALGGLLTGTATIVKNTWDTLAAFPDRLLLGEAVVWSREGRGRFYSSHRILSPMTNHGDSAFGTATGRAVLVRTIADCVIENGVITLEWLVRDNYSLVQQLGFDPIAVACKQAETPLTADHAAWLGTEQQRLKSLGRGKIEKQLTFSATDTVTFAQAVLRNTWQTGNDATYSAHYASYAVLYDSAPVASGRGLIAVHYAELRRALNVEALTVDHVCSNGGADGGIQVAVRWTLTARHIGPIWGMPASGAEILILGVSHWKIVAGRIAAECTIFDRLAVLTQIQRAQSGPASR